jgi:ketosteroid isomerase-like protein
MQNTQTEASKQLVLALYSAAGKGDFATALSLMDDNIAVIEPPYLPYGGVYRGKVEFQTLLARINEYADLSAMKMESVVAEGGSVFVCLQIGDRKTGKPLQLAERSIVRDGKIVEMKIFYFDAGSMIEAGLKAKA